MFFVEIKHLPGHRTIIVCNILVVQHSQLQPLIRFAFRTLPSENLNSDECPDHLLLISERAYFQLMLLALYAPLLLEVVQQGFNF